MHMLSIERRELKAQDTLVVRRRAARHELAQALAEGVGKVYTYAQQAGIALADVIANWGVVLRVGTATIHLALPRAGRVRSMSRRADRVPS